MLKKHPPFIITSLILALILASFMTLINFIIKDEFYFNEGTLSSAWIEFALLTISIFGFCMFIYWGVNIVMRLFKKVV